MSSTEDRNILEGILAGDEVLITEFYRNNLPYIRKYILQNSGNEEDVADVFQDALMVIYQKLEDDSLEITVSFRTYFYAICKNMWMSRLRKKRKFVVDDSLVIQSKEVDCSIQEDIENQEREHVFRKYFLTLTSSCKEVLELVFAGKSMKEIATVTGYTEGYARKKKYECKQSLMEKIQEDPMYQELKDVPKD